MNSGISGTTRLCPGATNVAASIPWCKKPFTLENEEAWIRARVAEKPDITGRELLAELNQRGIEVSYYGVSPRFRRVPFVRDEVFDHGGASAPRITAPHMLPSAELTATASAVLERDILRLTHILPPENS
jgi:hypothetical protein